MVNLEPQEECSIDQQTTLDERQCCLAVSEEHGLYHQRSSNAF